MAEQIPRILIVDDEAHIRQVMSLKMKGAGFEVHTASDGEEGYQAACELRPDLILSDFQMPRLTGLAMCQRLGKDPTLRKIPIILVTSRDFDIAGPDTIETGVIAVKNKPFSPREVLKFVEKTLAERGFKIVPKHTAAAA